MPRKAADHHGKVFNAWTVVGTEPVSVGPQRWLARCECGVEKVKIIAQMVSGASKSCGCKISELRAAGNAERLQRGLRKRLYLRALHAAKRRHPDYLSEDQWWWLVEQNCHICGASPTPRDIKYTIGTPPKREKNRAQRYGVMTVTTNGVDRLDSSVGYTVENSRPCCATCNRMKLDHSLEFMYAHMQKILDHKAKTDAAA